MLLNQSSSPKYKAVFPWFKMSTLFSASSKRSFKTAHYTNTRQLPSEVPSWITTGAQRRYFCTCKSMQGRRDGAHLTLSAQTQAGGLSQV